VTEQTAESYAATFGTSMLGTLLSMKHQLGAMQSQGNGSIVNISSTYGHEGARGTSVYAASKHAVEGLTKSAAGRMNLPHGRRQPAFPIPYGFRGRGPAGRVPSICLGSYRRGCFKTLVATHVHHQSCHARRNAYLMNLTKANFTACRWCGMSAKRSQS
jgi:hypothetical protein